MGDINTIINNKQEWIKIQSTGKYCHDGFF